MIPDMRSSRQDKSIDSTRQALPAVWSVTQYDSGGKKLLHDPEQLNNFGSGGWLAWATCACVPAQNLSFDAAYTGFQHRAIP